jgi:hypothetical protein
VPIGQAADLLGVTKPTFYGVLYGLGIYPPAVEAGGTPRGGQPARLLTPADMERIRSCLTRARESGIMKARRRKSPSGVSNRRS